MPIIIQTHITPSSIEIAGHASQNYICAAVSSAALVVANMIVYFKLEDRVELTVKSGDFKLKVKEFNETLEGLFFVLKDALIQLSEQYPNTVFVKEAQPSRP